MKRNVIPVLLVGLGSLGLVGFTNDAKTAAYRLSRRSAASLKVSVISQSNEGQGFGLNGFHSTKLGTPFEPMMIEGFDYISSIQDKNESSYTVRFWYESIEFRQTCRLSITEDGPLDRLERLTFKDEKLAAFNDVEAAGGRIVAFVAICT
jgi:hypothetical protein